MGVVERFAQIVPIDNPSGREDKLRAHIAEALRAMGVTDQTVDKAGNLLVRVPGVNGKDIIMLSAHMDSVPPCEGIVPVRDEKNCRPILRSEGRTILGADDKSGVATILEIVETLAKEKFANNHPLELFFSTEEEVGLNGAKGFDMNWTRAAYCYVLDGEGRVGMIFNAGPSQENLRIECTGKAAHAGISPEAGISAIQLAAAVCGQVPSGRLAEDLTTNLGVIEGGAGINVIAPSVTVKGEARSHSEPKLSGLLDQFRSVCQSVEAKFPGSKIEFVNVRRYNHFEVPADHPMIARVEAICSEMDIVPQLAPMNIGSDAHILNQNGLPTVVLGMGFHYSHSLGEFIYCEELAQVCELTLRLVRV